LGGCWGRAGRYQRGKIDDIDHEVDQAGEENEGVKDGEGLNGARRVEI
jgi:hypothetical protein